MYKARALRKKSSTSSEETLILGRCFWFSKEAFRFVAKSHHKTGSGKVFRIAASILKIHVPYLDVCTAACIVHL